jgi:tryptophan 2,3-dioxygenase
MGELCKFLSHAIRCEMDSTAEPSEIGTSWPEHVGIGGLNLTAADALPADWSGSRAHAALAKWHRTFSAQREILNASAFPFTEILRHYQVTGRLRVSPAFLGDLQHVLITLRDMRPPRDDFAGLLVAWLYSATDQENGDYESYLGEELLRRAIAASGLDEDSATDVLIGALVSDLARYEAAALLEAPASHPQQARTAAATRALARLKHLAPRAASDHGGVDALLELAGTDLPSGIFAESTGEAAAAILAALAFPFRYAVRTSMLPITPLHDEYMFMRSVQIFEFLYWQVARCLSRALGALLSGDQDGACEQFADAASRVEAMPVLYRIVTTMPREAFAIIRGLSNGRSAIQSRPYWLVETLTAPRELSAEIRDEVPHVGISGPTLQEAFAERCDRFGSASLRPVAETMRRLDRAWRAMKRTHWGITRKIIGEAPGTGGTTGVHYLEASAQVPLFPILQGDDVP